MKKNTHSQSQITEVFLMVNHHIDIYRLSATEDHFVSVFFCVCVCEGLQNCMEKNEHIDKTSDNETLTSIHSSLFLRL